MNTEESNKEKIISSPIETYVDFHQRIKNNGQMASFPEFKPVIDFLITEIQGEYVANIVKNNPILLYELKEVKTFLFHVNLKFDVEDSITYPYAIPFSEPFPYRPTIDAIESTIRFLDKVNRVDPDSKAVKLYHFDRYCYHRHSLVANQEIILFPTTQELSLVDFIKTRAVPVIFVGVIAKTMRVDGHYQSPLDFWYHDLNHARRLYAYIRNRLHELGYTSDEEIVTYIKNVQAFIIDVVMPNFVDVNTSMSEVELETRKMATMIIFEIIHETALTLESDSIISDILRPNGPQPFEVMTQEKIEDIESLRTPTGNLKSGASFATGIENNPTVVNYFFDKTSIGLLANVFSKLNHHYYDESNSINENIVSVPYRTPEFIVQVTKYILTVLRYDSIPSDEELLELVTDRSGLKERILHTPLTQHSVFAQQEATDPMKADEIIELIKGLNKKVYTLFGYSALGYEDDFLLEKTVRSDLENLSRDEYVINIGATEEGIGRMYSVAKELGFKTIGVVSTQALSYSGRFSDYVDSIYIVNDDYWGGLIPGTGKLSETTKAFLGISTFISAYGGGKNTAITLQFAKELGINFTLKEFDMNHELADKVSGGKITDYRGEAYASMQSSSI